MGNSDNSMVSEEDIQQSYWTVKASDEIVGLSDIYCRDRAIAHDIENNLAQAFVKLHNEWWDNEVWGSYRENIMVSSVSAFYGDRPVPLPESIKPLTEDEWFEYDDDHEAP